MKPFLKSSFIEVIIQTVWILRLKLKNAKILPEPVVGLRKGSEFRRKFPDRWHPLSRQWGRDAQARQLEKYFTKSLETILFETQLFFLFRSYRLSFVLQNRFQLFPIVLYLPVFCFWPSADTYRFDLFQRVIRAITMSTLWNSINRHFKKLLHCQIYWFVTDHGHLCSKQRYLLAKNLEGSQNGFVKIWANPGLFLFIFVFDKLKFYRKSWRRQQDSNSDRESRKQARWPLDHHTAPTRVFLFYLVQYHFYLKKCLLGKLSSDNIKDDFG